MKSVQVFFFFFTFLANLMGVTRIELWDGEAEEETCFHNNVNSTRYLQQLQERKESVENIVSKHT